MMEPRTCEEYVLQRLANAEMTINYLTEELNVLKAQPRTIWHSAEEEPTVEGLYIMFRNLRNDCYRISEWEPYEGWSWSDVDYWTEFDQMESIE